MPPPIHAAGAHQIAYRPLSENDYAFIEALYMSTRAEELALSGWPDELKRDFLVQQHHAQHLHYQRHYPEAEWLIVEQALTPIGRLYLERWRDQVRIIDISLVPAARGRGLGGAILRDVIAWAAEQRLATSIHVEKNNPARRLYDRLGFAVVADKGVYDLMLRRPEPGAKEDQKKIAS